MLPEEAVLLVEWEAGRLVTLAVVLVPAVPVVELEAGLLVVFLTASAGPVAFLPVWVVPLAEAVARPVLAVGVPVVLLTASAGLRAELAVGLEAAMTLPTEALPSVLLAAATSQAFHPMQVRLTSNSWSKSSNFL